MSESEKEISAAYRRFNRHMFHVTRMHHTLAERRVGELGIHRAQHMLLMHLARTDAPLSQKALAEHMEISTAAVAVALKKLEAGGYIHRASCCRDTRANDTHITERGLRIVAESRAAFDEIDAAMFSGISSEELALCLSVMQKIEENLKQAVCSDKKEENK